MPTATGSDFDIDNLPPGIFSPVSERRGRVSAAMRSRGLPPAAIVNTNFRSMYWHAAQQLAHLTSNGSRVRPGDVFGSGTVSGSESGSTGCLLELVQAGRDPLRQPDGEARTFFEDGDTVIMRSRAAAGDRCIGLGEVRGTIVG